MKKVAFASAVFLVFYGCGKADSTLLEGSWQLTERKMETRTGSTDQNTETKINPSESFVYAFSAGKIMVAPSQRPNQVDYEASYRVDGNDLLLQNQGQEFKFYIDDLSEKEMTLVWESEQTSRQDKIALKFERLPWPAQGFGNGQRPSTTPQQTPVPGTTLPQ